MATYSVDADLLKVCPQAADWAVDSIGDDPSGAYLFHQEQAYAEINSFLYNKTAIPVPSDTTVSEVLSEVEARMVAARLMKMNISQFPNHESAMITIRQYESDAEKLLKNCYFPASASTPASGVGFVGDGTISVSVSDAHAYRAVWTIRCIEAGTDTAVFEIYNNRVKAGGPWYYDLDTDNQWPSDAWIEQNTDLLEAVTVTITPGSTAFSIGDYWTFTTYPPYRANRKAGIGYIPMVRA